MISGYLKKLKKILYPLSTHIAPCQKAVKHDKSLLYPLVLLKRTSSSTSILTTSSASQECSRVDFLLGIPFSLFLWHSIFYHS